MPVANAEIDSLRRLTRAQLDELSRDFMQPTAVQRSARALLAELARDRLVAAVQNFDSAVPTFVDITKKLRALTEEARKDPVGDAVAQLTLSLRRFGELFDKVADVEHDPPAKSDVDASVPGTPPEIESDGPEVVGVPSPPAVPLPTPPPPGTATNSNRFQEISAEYVATFHAADIEPARAAAVDRQRRRLVEFKAEYEAVSATTRVPWQVIGLIHAMESSFNFGTHLHNGDSLAHRTVRVPAGRPSADIADPAFAWSTSAVDSLTRGNHQLHLVGNWSLARQLFELERYNGFGYRNRGIATPYLWSFSDRYIKGKFVRDGVFDPAAVSSQAGAAIIMKALIAANDISTPA